MQGENAKKNLRGSARYHPNSANWSQKPSDFPYATLKVKIVKWDGSKKRIRSPLLILYTVLKYLGVKSKHAKIRQEHTILDFEICVARDGDRMYL